MGYRGRPSIFDPQGSRWFYALLPLLFVAAMAVGALFLADAIEPERLWHDQSSSEPVPVEVEG